MSHARRINFSPLNPDLIRKLSFKKVKQVTGSTQAELWNHNYNKNTSANIANKKILESRERDENFDETRRDERRGTYPWAGHTYNFHL